MALSDKFRELAERIKGIDRIGLASHIDPDGDAVGSQLALAAILRRLGKEVIFFNRDSAPIYFDFIPGWDMLNAPPPDQLPEHIILLDVSDSHRLGEMWDIVKDIPHHYVVDHHIQNHPVPAFSLVDSSVSSTCELVYDWCNRVDWEITPAAALPMFVGILTDTGSFRYSNTTAKALRTASDLVSIGGIPVNKVALSVYSNNPLSKLRLKGQVLSGLELRGRFVLAEITLDKLAISGSIMEEAESIVEEVATIGEADVMVVFWELNRDEIRVQIRSRRGPDILKLAQEFGGGGHPRAAGFRNKGVTLQEMKEKVIAKAIELYPKCFQ